MRAGDTLVVPKLDRLARSVPDARAIGDSLVARGVKLSLGGTIYNPADPMGKMFFNILATFAEFEVDLLRLRTREGMAIAKAKGKLRGKQPKLNPASRGTWSTSIKVGSTPSPSWPSCSRSAGRPCIECWNAPAAPPHFVGRQRYVVRPIPCHNGDQPLCLIYLSVGGGSLRSRRIPCHPPKKHYP